MCCKHICFSWSDNKLIKKVEITSTTHDSLHLSKVLFENGLGDGYSNSQEVQAQQAH